MVNIVIPVDFSNKAEMLLDAGIKFSKEVNGKICLVHAMPLVAGFIPNQPDPLEAGMQYIPSVEHEEYRREQQLMGELEKRVTAAGVPCEYLLVQGEASQVVLDYARDKEAGYIVIGSHGHGNLYDLFVGSLTKALTKNSTIPLLVVPMHD